MVHFEFLVRFVGSAQQILQGGNLGRLEIQDEDHFGRERKALGLDGNIVRVAVGEAQIFDLLRLRDGPGGDLGTRLWGRAAGKRGDEPERRRKLLKGETERRRLGIPMYMGKLID